MREPPGNVALLIDADNAAPAGLDAVLTVLAEVGAVNIRRAYGNWSKAALSGWSKRLHEQAIEPRQQFDVTKGKNATDMRMVIDAMDLLYSGKVSGFGIMSSDSDFAPIAMRLRQDGLPVYGFGSSKTPPSFRQACTRFIDIESLPADQAAGPSAPEIDAAVIQILIDAYQASKRDDRGYAPLSEVGQRASARSSFDARNYGASRLSDLIERIPNFQVEKRDSQAFVKRLR